MDDATHAVQTFDDEHPVDFLGEVLRPLGFRLAFLDFATMAIHPVHDRDGRPALRHILEGLPDEAVAIRSPCGRVIATKATLIAGYERNGFFYTRAAAARAAAQW